MYNDQLNGLLALKAIAEMRNFSRAAKKLGITPSAISQTIKQLEQRLGVALLSRTTRSTSLTEAGARFLADASPALDQLLSALDNVGNYAQKASGLLRINLPRQVYRSYLNQVIESFIQKYPEITLELFFEDQASDVVEQGFDAGIRLSDILAKDVVALKLFGPIRFVPIASPKYLDRTGRPKHPEDLLNHSCICLRLGPRLYDEWEFKDKEKEFRVHVKGPLILNDSSLCIEAAKDGIGITYINEDAVKEQVQSGELEIILKQYAWISDGFYLYYPTRSQVMPKLRAFIEHIRNENMQ